LVSAAGNVSYANLSVNTNLTGQLRSRNPPLIHSRKSQRHRGSIVKLPPGQVSVLAWAWAGQ